MTCKVARWATSRRNRHMLTGLSHQDKGVLARAHPLDVRPPGKIKPSMASHTANKIRTALTSMGLASQAHGTHAAVQKRQEA